VAYVVDFLTIGGTWLLAFHDTNTVATREIMDHSGLEVTGEAFGSGASIVFNKVRNALARPHRARRLGSAGGQGRVEPPTSAQEEASTVQARPRSSFTVLTARL
jgi:hypothetical protein